MALLVTGALVALFVMPEPPSEPRFRSKRLSEWLEGYPTTIMSGSCYQIPSSEAHEAIRQIGTNAVPFLVKWIRHEPRHQRPVWKKLEQIINQTMGSQWWFSRADKKEGRTNAAMFALIDLGPKAECATADLAGLMQRQTEFHTAWRAANVLLQVGNAAWVPLSTVLTNQQAGLELRQFVARNSVGKWDRCVIPTFELLLNDPDEGMRSLALAGLQVLGVQGARGSKPSSSESLQAGNAPSAAHSRRLQEQPTERRRRLVRDELSPNNQSAQEGVGR